MKKNVIILTLVLALLLCGCMNSETGETSLPDPLQTENSPTTELATSPTSSAATVPVQTTASPETEPPIERLFPEDLELTVPEDLPEEFGSTPLELQDWFFQFAIDYQMNYFPSFTMEGGAPADSGAYLYWAYFMNRGNWTDFPNGGIAMPVSHVEEIVARYFGVTVVDHRSHEHSWIYEPENERYTHYAGGSPVDPTCLLTAMEYDPENSIITAYALEYQYRYYYGSEELDQLRQELIYGDKTDFRIRSQIIVKFRLDPETMEPRFLSFQQVDLMYL